jgi:outer membrane protein assembly factor BamE (lipoprotein component of BamABCDE complex)
VSLLEISDRIAVATLLSLAASTPLALQAAPSALSHAASVIGASQDVTESGTASIRRGMSEQDVLARLGEPFHRERFERTRTVAWDYRAHDSWGYGTEFSVIFDEAGKVVETVRVRLGD